MAQINLLQTDAPQTPSAGMTGIYIDTSNAPILVLDDGSTIPLGGTTLEQIYIDAITGGLSPSAENPFVTLEQLNQSTGGINTVLFGGVPQWSGSGLVFDAPFTGYIIEGVYYQDGPEQITLTAADGSNDRRDRFKLSSSGWGFDTGTPASVPVAPQVDPITEIDRGDVLIETSATTPTITNEDVYLENTEWTTSSGGTGTFDPDSTTAPFAGTKAFEATNVQAGGFMLFTNSMDYDFSTADSIGLHLRLKATMNNGRTIRLQFLDNSDVPVSQSVPLPIDKSISGSYQFVSLAKDQLGFVNFTVRKVRLVYSGTGGPASYSGFFVDNVIIQSGVSQAGNNTFTQDEIDAIKNANAPTAANPFATIADVSGASYPEAQLRASNTVIFDNDYIIGNSGARTGNILFDFTGAKLGATTEMLHDNDGAYTFPSEAVIRDFETTRLAAVTGDVKFGFTLVDKTASSEVVDVRLSLTEAQLAEYNA